nr:signal peptidase I [Kutzneria albida]
MPKGAKKGRHAHRKKPKGSFFRELVVLVVTALVLTVLIQSFLARVYVIPSGSMEQTLHGCDGCQNDRILVDKLTYRFTNPAPGDVVVFRGPPAWTHNDFSSQRSDNPVVNAVQSVASMFGLAPPDERDFVKRVIAVGGQTVQCCDNNRVVVDGKPLTEPYIYWFPGRGEQQRSFAPVKVPEGRLWVMGDSRNNSEDSRFQGGGGVNGTIGVDDVIGKARVIVLPPSRWGVVHAQDPQVVAMGAPAWQQGLPLTGGVALAVPVVWAVRRTRSALLDQRQQRP